MVLVVLSLLSVHADHVPVGGEDDVTILLRAVGEVGVMVGGLHVVTVDGGLLVLLQDVVTLEDGEDVVRCQRAAGDGRNVLGVIHWARGLSRSITQQLD